MTETSVDTQTKVTVPDAQECAQPRLWVSPLANDSFAPGARSWTISRSAVPSAPAPANAHADVDGGSPSRSPLSYRARAQMKL
jgi:hypothetical protein